MPHIIIMTLVITQKITVDSVWCTQHTELLGLCWVCGTQKNQSDSIWRLWNPKELRVTLYGVCGTPKN